MPNFAEVVTQTFRSFSPEAISERLFGDSLDAWWRDYQQSIEATDYKGPIQVAFFIATFIAMGRVCKADGRVKEAEINLATSVMDHLELTTEQKRIAIRLFNEGKQPDFNIDVVLNRFHRICRHRVSVMQVFVETQLQAAMADGPINDIEEAILLRMCQRVDVSKTIYLRIKRRVHENKFGAAHKLYSSDKPMNVSEAGELLGVTRWTTKDEVKKAYRRLMSQYHPDKMQARGCSAEELEQARHKAHDIKRAFEIISKARKIR